MTLLEAKNYLIAGDLAAVYRNKACGASMSQIFVDCMSCVSSQDLDRMVEKCLGLVRRIGFYQMGCNVPSETDAEYRTRAEVYSLVLDQYAPSANDILKLEIDNLKIEPSEPPCFHSWKVYQGLFERDEYCTRCNKKRKI